MPNLIHKKQTIKRTIMIDIYFQTKTLQKHHIFLMINCIDILLLEFETTRKTNFCLLCLIHLRPMIEKTTPLLKDLLDSQKAGAMAEFMLVIFMHTEVLIR
jgi:hypothetical protein